MPIDFPVSWIETHSTTKLLSSALKASGHQWKKIIAVTRGGMIPACLVARDLGIRDIDTISVVSYDHQTQSAARVGKLPEGVGDGDGCLVVDDLSDTGNTFRALRDKLPKAFYACIYVKPQGKPLADFYASEVSQDTWIYFPWEDQDFPPHIMEKIGAHL